MGTFETLKLDAAEGIATISLNRPDRLNAFNRTMRLELCEAVNEVSNDSTVRAVVLSAEGRSFCAGADLSEIYPEGQTAGQRLEEEYKPFLLAIHESPKPFIASVQGAAAGIGSAVVMACDLAVMEEGAYFYQAFSAIGLIPDGGATWHLSRTLGSKRAYEIMLTGERVSAQCCLDWGLVNRVAAAGNLAEETQKFAREIALRAPLSARYTKEAMHTVISCDLSSAISVEAELQTLASKSLDHAEGKKAFLEKRPPVWKGH